MANIKGGKSTQIALRLPNDLYELAMSKARAEGLINDDGNPSTTLFVTAAVKGWLGLSDERSPVGNQDVIQKLQTKIEEVLNNLSNKIDSKDIETLKSEILTSSQEDSYLINAEIDKLSDRLTKIENLTSGQTKQGNHLSIPEEAIATETETKQDDPLVEITQASYTKEQLDAMNKDDVRTIYRDLIPSYQRPKADRNNATKDKMIELILERQ